MKLTPDQLRQNAAAMIAHADGKPIEFRDVGGDFKWERNETPHWSFKEFEYRPKPEPKVRAWNCPADVPLNCWLRYSTSADSCQFIADINIRGIVLNLGDIESPVMKRVEFSVIAAHWHHSTDRLNWKPCTVEVPA